MELQRIDVKLFADAPDTPPLDPFLAIFGRWREDKEHPARWVDVADYAHVVRGPGIVLIGKRGNLGVDLTPPGPGILYSNRRDLEGALEERILEVFRRALALAEALLAEPDYPAELEPRPGFWRLAFNDRLEVPNTEASDRRVGPPARAALDALFGAGGYTAIRESDPDRRYGFLVHSDAAPSLAALNARLLSRV